MATSRHATALDRRTADRKVVVCGQGYVGLPIAMASVRAGMSVVGYEVAHDRVQRLIASDSYVEDISNSELGSAIASGRYLPTSSVAQCKGYDVAVITVPTPLRNGVPDLTYIEKCVRELAPMLSVGSTVILESTTYPGTTEELVAPILSEESGLIAGEDFYLGYSPERIDPGNADWSLRNTPKVVSGINDKSLASVQAFYERIIDTVVPVSTTRVAELCKLLENTFRHVNIALVNELAAFAGALDVDVWEAISAASTKPFGFMPFRPGPGVGGHCLPVDPTYLSWKVHELSGSSFRFIELANDINDHMPKYVAQRSVAILNSSRLAVNGSVIVILGLAYKANLGDIREAPGPVLCKLLSDMGATVLAVDPMLAPDGFPDCVTRADLSESLLTNADLVVVVTDHDAFDWNLILRASPRLFDTRHRVASAPHVSYL
jgi:UDP-N-acetyl-D-glucosamine dehydrogenase